MATTRSPLLGRDVAEAGFRKILVAVDGSPVAMRAVEHALRLARADDAELVAVHVVPSPPIEVPGELADYYDRARVATRRWMKDVEELGQRTGVPLRTDIVVGAYSVVDAVLGYAETISADLIVTGTRGRTPSRRILVGSVASGLVEYASCAVLVVR